MTSRCVRCCAAAVVVGVAGTAATAQQWDLVWEDNFDGFVLDPTKWEYLYGTGAQFGLNGWGNNELQYYTDSTNNVRVVAGELRITARNEFFMGQQYTSGRIRTKDRADFQYGRFEARIQMPSARGVWPAFWLLPTNSPYGFWPSSGEIDVMESVNFADRIYGTLHYGFEGQGSIQTGGSTTLNGTDFGAEFFTYAVEWEPNQIRWYINGDEWGSATNNEWFSGSPEAAGNPIAPFDQPFHMILNVAVGGNFPGPPTASDYPSTMTVDYVRVYQPMQVPFTQGQVPHAVPGSIEAEDFDDGFAGQSYFDSDPNNQGGQYRDTGVDLEICSEGGFNVGYIQEGEWLEYTIDVAQAGTYRADVRTASLVTGGEFRFEVDGQPVSSTVYALPTGDWQNWTTTSVELELEAGQHVLRWANQSLNGSQYNVNRFDFVQLTAPCLADMDGNGTLNVDDIDAYATAFLGSDLAADCDGNGTLNVDDIDCFATAFLAGCP